MVLKVRKIHHRLPLPCNAEVLSLHGGSSKVCVIPGPGCLCEFKQPLNRTSRKGFADNYFFLKYVAANAPLKQEREPSRWLYDHISERGGEKKIFIQTVILPTNGREQQWNGENVPKKMEKHGAYMERKWDIQIKCMALEYLLYRVRLQI